MEENVRRAGRPTNANGLQGISVSHAIQARVEDGWEFFFFCRASLREKGLLLTNCVSVSH